MYRRKEYKYVGAPMMTRGDYGVRVDGGHSKPDDPEGIYVFDPDVGDIYFGQAPDPDFILKEES